MAKPTVYLKVVNHLGVVRVSVTIGVEHVASILHINKILIT
jgi:hypothetical protein